MDIFTSALNGADYRFEYDEGSQGHTLYYPDVTLKPGTDSHASALARFEKALTNAQAMATLQDIYAGAV